MGLVEGDKVHLFIEADKELEGILKSQKPSLMMEVNAQEIEFGKHGKGKGDEYEIEESKLKIWVEKEK